MSATSVIGESDNDLISEEVQEIISNRPHWLVRKGNTFFLLIVMLLLFLTWLIRFPDVVEGEARLTALNAPKLITARTDGKLQKLFVQNETKVKDGQYLALLQSTANGEEILQLKTWLDNILSAETREAASLAKMDWPSFQHLGELQAVYGEFHLVKKETEQLLAGGYYQKKRAALQKDLQYLSQMQASGNEQKGLLQKDQQLQQKEFEAYETLAEEKVIAPLELNQYKSKLIAKEQALEQVQSTLIGTNLASLAKQKELMELQKFEMDQEQEFSAALLNLSAKVEEWLLKYVIRASQSGVVNFMGSLQENQQVAGGQELFYIQTDHSNYVVELMVPQKGLGKIRQGQTVLLKAESFPSEQFGHLKGKVVYISSMPSRTDSFLIKAELVNGLQTNEEKQLHFRHYLVARAEIITDERRLIERFFEQLAAVVKE